MIDTFGNQDEAVSSEEELIPVRSQNSNHGLNDVNLTTLLKDECKFKDKAYSDPLNPDFEFQNSIWDHHAVKEKKDAQDRMRAAKLLNIDKPRPAKTQ